MRLIQALAIMIVGLLVFATGLVVGTVSSSRPGDSMSRVIGDTGLLAHSVMTYEQYYRKYPEDLATNLDIDTTTGKKSGIMPALLRKRSGLNPAGLAFMDL